MVPREETGLPRGTDLAEHFTVGQVVRVELLESKEGKLRLRLEGATPIVEERPARPAGGPREGGAPAGRSSAGRLARRARRVAGRRTWRPGRPAAARWPAARTAALPTSWSTPKQPNEPTTMALALRKAMEQARRKADGATS